MPQTSKNNELEDISEDDFFDSLDDNDFVFVLNSEGELKTLVLPEQYDSDQVPENIINVLKVFGLTNINSATLH